MFTAVRTKATAKNGAVRITSARVTIPRRHQINSSRIPGRIATEPLLNIASTNAARLIQYHAARDDRGVEGLSVDGPVERRVALRRPLCPTGASVWRLTAGGVSSSLRTNQST